MLTLVIPDSIRSISVKRDHLACISITIIRRVRISTRYSDKLEEFLSRWYPEVKMYGHNPFILHELVRDNTARWAPLFFWGLESSLPGVRKGWSRQNRLILSFSFSHSIRRVELQRGGWEDVADQSEMEIARNRGDNKPDRSRNKIYPKRRRRLV